MKECFACDLAMHRNRIVYGIGNKDANIMVVCGFPGYYEDKHGVPCSSQSGLMVTRLLSSVAITTKNAYFTNILKCKPKRNIKPSNVELNTCTKLFLKREISVVKPKFIITLGLAATNLFLNNNISIGKVINNIYKVGNMFILPAYDPDYIVKENKEMEYSVQLKNIVTLINKNL